MCYTTRITRKQKLKDLMLHKTKLDQGLTLVQILNEIYSDEVEKCFNKDIDWYGDWDYWYKLLYIRKCIKEIKTTDGFRWLSPVPVKRNQIDPNTGKKVRPYLEYRFVNINATTDPELLTRANAYMRNVCEGSIRGLKAKRKRLLAIADTPQEVIDGNIKKLLDSLGMDIKDSDKEEPSEPEPEQESESL